MLVLGAESACDICAEPYSQESLPHSIPCGHTFCAQCLTKVSKGGASQWAPRNTSCGCPLCREPFAAADIRRIRIDTAPSHSPPYPQVLPYPNYFPAQNISTKAGAGAAFGKGPIDEDALDAGSNEVDRVTVEAKRLEQRVADAAKRRCTFEEISALHREVQQWLDKQGSRRPDREHGSLRLSAALLGAILVNGFAYNESKKQLKGVEVELKEKLDAVEGAKRRLELEVHRQRTEVYTLKQEMSKLTGAPPPALPPVTPTTVPVSSTTNTAPPVPRPLGSSLTASHSATSNLAHRSQTPAPLSSRTHTPAATPTRSQTPSAASAYSGYMHHTSTVSPPRSTVTSASSSRSPERPPVPGQHQRWMPQTTREDDGDVPRPGTAFNPHARAYSLSGRLAAPGARPQTAAGFRP